MNAKVENNNNVSKVIYIYENGDQYEGDWEN